MAGTMASTQAEDMLARDRSGAPVSPTEPVYEAIAAIIGAAAAVTHDVPANAIVAGNPARIIGNVQD